MCGISGFVHFDVDRPACPDVIKKMACSLIHRGPDGEGFYVKQHIALGHRRLSIIDIAGGQQPMYSDDQDIILVFNGEIYNYIELKDELVGLGNKFTTTSDTEVIINAYRTWGIDCQKHFNGMWAFALWDLKLQRLLISRDRIGEKPLYYSTFDNSFIFGSEIKSLIAYGIPVKPRIDVSELYLTMGFVPAPYTFYDNIHQLMPGNYLLVNSEGLEPGTYWDLPDISESDLTKDKKFVEREFSRLFENSVRIRMRCDVEFGAFLSGGLDSSCIVSAMVKQTSKPVRTFTMGFDNKEFDESDLAKLVADKFHTNHHKQIVSSEHFEDALNTILFHYDEPFGDASAIPTGRVSQYAAQYVKMVLTGDGGDEVLSGYNIYKGEKFATQYQVLPRKVQQMVNGMAKLSAKPFRGRHRYRLNRIAEVLESSSQAFEKRLLSKLSYASPKQLSDIIPRGQNLISFYDFYDAAMKGCRFKDTFYKLMYFQHKVTFPGDMLTQVYRISMAHSI